MWTSEGGDFEQPKPGLQVGRFYRIIEVGTQTDTYKGETTIKKKALIFWELAQKMDDGKPFSVFKEYTQSLGTKATLRKHLESWAGKVMTEEQHKNFDPKKLLGMACMLNLILNSNDKIKVDGIMAVPQGTAKPALFNPTQYFSMEAFDKDAFQALPDWIRAKIESSPEFKKLNAGSSEDNGQGADSFHSNPADDIPF